MHRMLTAIVLLVALTTSTSLAAAQEATPVAGRDRMIADTMGLPELAITATADAWRACRPRRPPAATSLP